MASLEGMNGEMELDNPNDVDYNRRTIVMILMIREAPQKKKRENVGILKKQGGGSTPIPLPFFTVFNMGDPP